MKALERLEKLLGKSLDEILKEEQEPELSAMAGLRNVLAHMYADIDYELLYMHAKELLRDAQG